MPTPPSPTKDYPHGQYTRAVRQLCECNVCDDYRGHHYEEKRKKRLEQRANPDLVTAPHGSVGRYNDAKCRCGLCVGEAIRRMRRSDLMKKLRRKGLTGDAYQQVLAETKTMTTAELEAVDADALVRDAGQGNVKIKSKPGKIGRPRRIVGRPHQRVDCECMKCWDFDRLQEWTQKAIAGDVKIPGLEKVQATELTEEAMVA